MNAQLIPSNYTSCISKYELDLMTGCTVNCIYCSLKNAPYETLDIAALLSSKLPEDIYERGIYLSPNADAFAKPVRENAHKVLDCFLPQGIPFLIITKNRIPDKTIDLLAKYPMQVFAQISMGHTDDVLNAYLEPGAAKQSDRLENISRLTAAGINTVALLMPIFPEIDDTPNALNAMVCACADAGAKYLKAAYVVIHPKDTYAKSLMQSHPLLKHSWDALHVYEKIHIGGGLTVPEQRRLGLYDSLNALCSNYGMKFFTCPILDLATLKNSQLVCRTYTKKNNLRHR